jgi:VWFA-related protein
MRFPIASLAFLLVLARPQEAQPPQPEPKLVFLNVIAVDAHGDPVTDLTSDDFQITDAGKLQKIAFFRHRDAKPEPALSLKPNEFSNRTSVNSSYPTVILFDVANIAFGSREEAANDPVRSLEPLEAADDLYLYLLLYQDGRLYPVRPFVVGTAGLSDGSRPWTRQIKPLLDAAMSGVLSVTPPGGFSVGTFSNFPDKALDTLASGLSQIPGRKNVVWVTGIRGFVGLGRWRPHAEALARSGVAIYPVPQSTLAGPGLDELAGLTGGRLNQGNDIGAAIKQSRSDLRTSYQIGYFPPPRNWDGKFHKLRVACKRKGVRIRAESGYSAIRDADETEVRRALDTATSADSDAAEIGLRVTTSPDASDPQMEHFSLHIDANAIAIAIARQGGQYTAQIRLASVAYMSDGQNQNSRIVGLSPRYSVQQRDQVLTNGIDFNQDLKVDVNVSKIRFIVFDRGSNAVGSITVPVNTGARLPF